MLLKTLVKVDNRNSVGRLNGFELSKTLSPSSTKRSVPPKVYVVFCARVAKVNVGSTFYLSMYHHALHFLNFFIYVFLWFTTCFQIFVTLGGTPEIMGVLVLLIIFTYYSNALYALLHIFIIFFSKIFVFLFSQGKLSIQDLFFQYFFFLLETCIYLNRLALFQYISIFSTD